jgi:molybdopterin-guanine dinucleotide biosynthesis protein A
MTANGKSPFEDCTVAILAGGQASRMGRLGQFYTKAALAVYDCPLLVRLLDQARSAGCPEIIISTGPSHFYQLDELITSYRRTANSAIGTAQSNVRLVSTDAHQEGSLEALSVVLEQVTTRRCVMCLGDIFFLGNPFVPLAGWAISGEICLGVADAVLPEDLTQGGLVLPVGQRVEAIIEQPRPDANAGMRWSGMALFCTVLAVNLKQFLADAPHGSPEGDFFAFCLEQGQQVMAVPGPDFVNVNSPEHLLLAGLYALLEKDNRRAGFYDSLVNTTLQLRKELTVSEKPSS